MASLTYIPKAPSSREGPGKHLRQKQSHHEVPEQGDAEQKGEVGIAAESPTMEMLLGATGVRLIPRLSARL